MSTPYFALSDGTTTIEIMNGSAGANYALVDETWAPSVAGRRRAKVGGRDGVEDVPEEFDLYIKDTTVPGAYLRLETLNLLLDQAEGWYQGEAVAPVLMLYAPGNSAVSSSTSPLQATILGRADGNATSAVGLSAKFNNATFTYDLVVHVRFMRHGRWLLADSEDSNAAASVNNGDLATISGFNALTTPGPTTIEITNVGYGTDPSGNFWSSLVLLAEDSTDIVIVNAESMTASGYTSVSGSAKNARNTNVLRYTPGGTTATLSGGASSLTFNSACDLVAVYANVRGSSTVDFTFRVLVASGMTKFSDWVKIPATASPHPQWVFCGLVARKGSTTGIVMETYASAGSSTFDVDTVVLVNARTVWGFSLDAPNPNITNYEVCQPYTVTVDHRLLTDPAPIVLGGSDRVLPHNGQIVITTKADTLYGLLLGTGDDDNTAGDMYRQTDAGSVLPNTWTVERLTAFLTPR